jgi:hypothetical protein
VAFFQNGLDLCDRKNLLLLLTISIFQFSSASADEKAGWFLGAGISLATYRADVGNELSLVGSWTPGWRLEAGYIWDVGSAGGFHLGIVGNYDDFLASTVKGEVWTGRAELQFESDMFALSVLLEQEIARWIDFVFRIGPGYGTYTFDESYSEQHHPLSPYSETSSGTGWVYQLGLAFFPGANIAVETNLFANWVISSDHVLDAWAVAGVVTTLQYRF